MIMIHNSMVCLRVHYCVQLLPEVILFFTCPLHFPLLKFFLLFSQLVSFIENSQKCWISQNIWCLIKTQLKNITQTIFQGGSPWATLIHNSMVCLRVHYCVQLLPEVIVFFFYLKVNWNQLQVNWNQLKVTWNELKVTWIQLKVNWNQLKVNWNQMKVNWNQLKVTSNQLKVTSNQLKVNWNQFKMNWNQLKVNWNQFKVTWN